MKVVIFESEDYSNTGIFEKDINQFLAENPHIYYILQSGGDVRIKISIWYDFDEKKANQATSPEASGDSEINTVPGT
jgi:hypothetical protein